MNTNLVQRYFTIHRVNQKWSPVEPLQSGYDSNWPRAACSLIWSYLLYVYLVSPGCVKY